MLSLRIMGISCGLLCGVSLLAAEGDSKKKSELAWAKEIATDFLNAGLRGTGFLAEALATAEFKKTLRETGQNSVTFLVSEVYDMGSAESWAITSEAIAPDKDEALFRGAFRGKKGEATFALRVVKEKDNGKWRVGYFAPDQYKERGDKPKK